jgi:hypothetical protein
VQWQIQVDRSRDERYPKTMKVRPRHVVAGGVLVLANVAWTALTARLLCPPPAASASRAEPGSDPASGRLWPGPSSWRALPDASPRLTLPAPFDAGALLLPSLQPRRMDPER